MAFVLDDRVRETSTAPGTGSFTMNGAVQGAQTFASALTSNGDTTWYEADNGTAWETGLLTRTSATVYARTTIFRSTNGNAAVNFATGTVSVSCDLSASKAKVLERLLWAAAAVTPPTNDGTALGTGALAFSDLFLASGGVLNFNNGNYTITHSAGLLSFSASLNAAGTILSSSPAGIGYSTGAGGAVTQATNKGTGVTINAAIGRITMNNAALAAGATAFFQVTNSSVGADDFIGVQIIDGFASGNTYRVTAEAASAGSFYLFVTNISAGSLSEAIRIRFVVIKGAVS